MDIYHTVIRPLVTEKSAHQARTTAKAHGGTYSFEVHPDANKTEIKDAVQRIFDVKVVRVNTMWRRGKQKRTRYTLGTRASQKRAVVTLAEGDTIEIFNPSR